MYDNIPNEPLECGPITRLPFSNRIRLPLTTTIHPAPQHLDGYLEGKIRTGDDSAVPQLQDGGNRIRSHDRESRSRTTWTAEAGAGEPKRRKAPAIPQLRDGKYSGGYYR